MNRLKSKNIIIPAIYFLAVCTCLFFAFDFNGAVNGKLTLVLIGLTLPWSMISVLFMWALFHGAGLELFAIIFLAFGGLNTYFINHILRKGID